jgi:hypothetical protein
VRDRLLGLGHHAVVRSHDKDGDVRDLGAASAHRGERFVARRVEEGDPAAVVLDLVRTDVLRDPAGLGRDDTRLADCVEQRRLPVVDVAHDRDDRRPLLERLFRVVEPLGLLVLLADVFDLDLALELGRDQLDLVVRQRLRRRPHLAEVHQDLDQLGHLDAERLGEVADGDARLDRHRPGGRRDLARLLRALSVGALALLARVARWARGRLVDHDTALPALAGSALTRPHRPVGSVGA